MLPIILFVCLVVQIGLALKLLIFNPFRKLNLYLSAIPCVSVFSTIIEINLCYINDVVLATKFYQFYQYLAFFPIIFLTLSLAQYIKVYTKNYNKRILAVINVLVVLINLLWILLLIIQGPSAKIHLTNPGIWSIERNSLTSLFYCHTIVSMLWLVFSIAVFIYLAFKATVPQKRSWFRVLSFFQFITVLGIIYFFTAPIPSPEKVEYDLTATIPITIVIILQLWVLSNFTIFDITPKNIYTDVLASINNWLVVLNEDGRISYLNESILNKTKYKSLFNVMNMYIDELLEVKINDVKADSCWNFLQDSGHNNFSEIVVTFKVSGEMYNLQSSLKKIILPDNSVSFLWVLIDTTTIEALKSNKKIIEANSAELSKANNDISFIMNITSHDLKAPLKTLIELSALVKDENMVVGKNRSEEYLNYITSVSNQALAITTRMIEYISIGIVDKKRELMVMETIITSIKERLFTQIHKSGAVIYYTGCLNIFCDAYQINELLANFIDNSIKYKSNNNPIIIIEVKETLDKYYFSIKDNGIGIREVFLTKIFSRYSREENTGISGSGIGLYLCKKIIESNNGTINIINNTNEAGITVLFDMDK